MIEVVGGWLCVLFGVETNYLPGCLMRYKAGDRKKNTDNPTNENEKYQNSKTKIRRFWQNKKLA